jgi:glycosyltransferase involved in cell wall biosynthesis
MESKDNAQKNDEDLLDLVSIVITTKNEEKNISNCLQSIKEQTYPKNFIEIIVIDNQSIDRTKDIARKFTEKVFDKGPERSAQRNFGILSIAKGDYILFLDADMILSPCLVDRCVNKMLADDLLGLYVPEIILGNSFWCQVRRFERSFYDGTVIDVARFVRKDVFERVESFDESMSGPEDWDFDKKLRSLGKVGLLESDSDGTSAPNHWKQAHQISQLGVDPSKYVAVIFHNESDFKLKTYIKKKGYYSRDMDRYIEKWGREDPDIRKQLGLYYRFLGVFMESGKWKRFVIRPDLAIGIYFLRFLVGLQYLFRKRTW